jgi:hypothetical protein
MIDRKDHIHTHVSRFIISCTVGGDEAIKKLVGGRLNRLFLVSHFLRPYF